MKRFCVTFAVVVATMAVFFTVSLARAATPPHGNPTLVVRLDADGSLTLSQRDSDTGAVIPLPSIQALPAQIDTLVPRTEERKKLAVAAESTGPYGNLLKVMSVAKKAGFSEIGILGPEKETQGEGSQLVVSLQRPNKWPPSKNALFVSLGDDGDVVLRLGLGDNAQEKVVSLASAPDAATGLVPKGRPQKEMYFRADVAVPVGDVIGLLRKLRAIGFENNNINIVAEQPE